MTSMNTNLSYQQFLQQQQQLQMQQAQQAQQALKSTGISTFTMQVRQSQQQLMQLKEDLQQAQSQIDLQLDAQKRRLFETQKKVDQIIQQMNGLVQESQGPMQAQSPTTISYQQH